MQNQGGMVVGNSTHKIFMGKRHSPLTNLKSHGDAVYRWKCLLGLIVKDFPKFQVPYDNMVLGTRSYYIKASSIMYLL